MLLKGIFYLMLGLFGGLVFIELYFVLLRGYYAVKEWTEKHGDIR